MASRLFAELSGPAISTTLTEKSILIQPIGAIEHHGPHLPLVTDALMAESAATAAITVGVEAGLDLWQLPTVSVGKSDEHYWAPGTLWLSASTLMSVLEDIGRSVATTPAKKIVFMNGHGGNVALLQVANRQLRRLFGLQTFTMPAMRIAAGTGQDGEPDEFGQGIHGGYAETSAIMHLRPDLVDESLFARNVPEYMADFEQLGFNAKPVSFGWLSDDFGPSGVIGDPTGANAEAGKRGFDASIELAVASLQEIDRFTLPPRP
ncbi:creatininase family protein [soil metagenome]